MIHKFAYYSIYLHIDYVWNRTLEFWKNNEGEILNQFISADNLYRKLTVRHGTSVHRYVTLMGETYEIIFRYHPYENITYISVDVKFANFGKFSRWLRPQYVMRDWAQEMGIPPKKLTRKQNLSYLEKISERSNSFGQKSSGQPKYFCPICGHEHIYGINFCEKCGTNLTMEV